MMTEQNFVPWTEYQPVAKPEMIKRSQEFLALMKRRRTVRDFSNRSVDRMVIDNCLRVAARAPSGANQQPWHFVVVSNPEVKKNIRAAAEAVEMDFYSKQATQTWQRALKTLKTGPSKPFLEIAPYLIAIFSRPFDLTENGEKIKHYYVAESVGIATGMLITALHQAGLATLTYTPATMRFLNKLLNRPPHEKAFMILVTGYPAEDVQVPVIPKRALTEVVSTI